MKCQILFPGKNKKNVTNMSSAEILPRVLSSKTVFHLHKYPFPWSKGDRHAVPILMKGYVKETQEYLVCSTFMKVNKT